MAKKKIVIETKYTVNGAEKAEKSYKNIGDEANKGAKATDKLNKNANAFGDVMPGKLGVIQSGFIALKSGIMKAVMGFKTLRGAVMSTGIGAVVILFGALAQYFTDNEEGAGKLKQITAQLGVVFGNITDVISDFGKAIFEAFSNPKQAVKDLWEAIKTNLLNRVEGMSKMFSALGNVVKSAMDLDFEKLKKASSELGEAYIQTATGVENLSEKLEAGFKKIKEFAKETNKEMAIAKQLEIDRLALTRFERTAIVDKAKAERDMMGLRLKARDEENFATQERLGFMREANKIAEEQLAKDLHVAREKLRMRTTENTFSKSSKENLDEEAKLKAEVFRIEKANFSERKRMKSEEQALVKQQLAKELAEVKRKEALAKKEEKILRDRAKLTIELQKDSLQKQIDLITFNAEQKRLKLKEEGVLTNELEKQLAEKTARDIQAVKDKALATELASDKSSSDASKKLAKDKADYKAKLEGALNTQILNFASSLSSALGEESKTAMAIQKTVALAQIGIDTAKAISSLTAVSSANPLNSVTFGGAGAIQYATGLLQIGSNLAQAYSILKKPAPSLSGGGGGGGTAPTTTQTAPDLGFKGKSAGAESFGSPVIKAYVTESEITTSQNNATNIQQLSQIG